MNAAPTGPPPGAGPAETIAGRVLRHTLSPADADRAAELAVRCLHRYGSAEAPDFLADAAVLATELPLPVRRVFNAARLDDRKHAILLSGNPVDQDALGATPLRWQEANTSASASYGVLLVLYGALLGDAIGWLTQQDGRLVADVLPTPGHEQWILNSCSTRELVWHNEDAFSPYRADYIGLCCLRSPDHTATTLSFVDPADVPPDIAAVLTQPRFVIYPDNAHDAANNTAPEVADAGGDSFARLAEVRADPPKIALLHGHPDAPVLRIDRDFVAAAAGDRAAARALTWLIGHLDRNLYDLPMVAGDVCFVDNRNAVHGRRPFRARYDGTDRWLKRVNVVTDLRRSRPVRTSAADRVIGRPA